MKKANSKSPIRDQLLRLPGQSIDEQINNILNERILNYALFASGFLLLALGAWVEFFTHSQLNPWIFSAVAILINGYCGFGAVRTAKELKRLRLGRDGERAVAEELDALKKQGAVILHDLVTDGFNLDHVVLSKQGIFVVETKTYSKPAKGAASVTFDGETVLVNGLKPERNPVTQAKANAKWLDEMLRASTGKEFPVRPVVLFPGWFVDPFPKGSSVWVLNPRALPSFIQHEPTRVGEADLHLAAFHLARYIKGRAQSSSPKSL